MKYIYVSYQVRGVRYMDGAFSDNLPLLDEHTVTVSPFCGESDICPRDQNPHLLQLNINWANTCIRLSRRNLRRMVRILVPGRADFMANFCQQGYDDTLQFLRRNSLLNEGFKIQEKGMISWIHQQMEREKQLRESPRDLEKVHTNRMTTNNVQHKKRRNRKQRTQRQTLQRTKKNQQEKIRNGRSLEMEIRNQEKNHQESTNSSVENLTPIAEKRLENKPPEEHNHYGSSLMGSTWSLLRRVMFAPPLARHMVQVIARHLSQSLTLCDQPHFDLALMQAPAACHPSTTSCPPSTPLGDSDNDKVKAQCVCEASQIESEDQVAEVAEVEGTSGVH